MERGKQSFRVIGYLAVPLIFYMVIHDVMLLAWQALRGGILEAEILPVGAVGAAIAAVFLGWRYRLLRMESRKQPESWKQPESRKQPECRKQPESRMQPESQKQPERALVQVGRSPSDLVLIILLAVCCCISLNNLLILSGIQTQAFDRVSRMLSGPALPVQLICTGVVIPLTEELIFRGLGFYRLRQDFSLRTAVVISSVYFALFHGNLLQGIYALILGALMAFLYEAFDSLAAPWIFHVAANLTSILMTGFGLEQYMGGHRMLMLAVTAAGILLAAAVSIRMDLAGRCRRGNRYNDKKR